MNLYQINAEIEKCLLEALDPETGEIVEENLNFEALDALEIEKDQKIENIAKWIKNLKAEAEALKVEKLRLADRQKKAESKIENLTNYLDQTLGGSKWQSDDGVVKIAYRKSKKVDFEAGWDEETVKAQLMAKDRHDLLSYKMPTLNKTALKDAILKNGEIIDGVIVAETASIQIK